MTGFVCLTCGTELEHEHADWNCGTGPVCRVCGCTDEDCSDCVERTGEPCYWVGPDLCSACAANEGDDK
jgi:hypothetical protein